MRAHSGKGKMGRGTTPVIKMRRSVLGPLVTRLYRVPALGRLLLKFVVLREGGQIYSLTLRDVLQTHHAVRAGPYSYGSLLSPGAADPNTVIGAYVSIGPSVRRFGANHPVDRPFLNAFTYNPALGLADRSEDVERTQCEVGDDAWIGANVVITAGCRRIGTGAVVGAGSVVTRDVEDFAIVAGVPARQISSRLDPALQEEILDLRLDEIQPAALIEWARARVRPRG